MRAPPQSNLSGDLHVVRICEEQFLPCVEVAAAAAAARLGGGGPPLEGVDEDNDMARGEARSRITSTALAYKEREKTLRAKEEEVAAEVRSAKELKSKIEESILVKTKAMGQALTAEAWAYAGLVTSKTKALQKSRQEIKVVQYVWGACG